MPYKRKNNKTTKKAKSTYRNNMSQVIPYANNHPQHAIVKFRVKEIYSVANNGANVNAPSILTIPVSDLTAPTAVQGTWSPNGTWDFLGYQNFHLRYRHYIVLGCKIQITTSSLESSVAQNQTKNVVYLSQTSQSSDISVTATNEELMEAFNTRFNYYYNAGSTREGSQIASYSPSKVWSIKKNQVSNRADLKCSANTTPGSAPDRTFQNIILKDLVESGRGHQPTLVKVQVDYMVKFVEPSPKNDSTEIN